MDVEVYYGGQRGGSMPYSALPAFRLFCRQYGFQIKWDVKSKRLDLESGLKGKICVLGLSSGGTEHYLEREIMQKVQKFLSDLGVQVILVEKMADVPDNRDVAVRLTVKEVRSLDSAKLLVFQGEDTKRRILVESLLAELKNTGISCQSRVTKLAKSAQVFLPIQLQLPFSLDLSKGKALGERVAFYLASGILSYFQDGQQIGPISYLPPPVLQTFFNSVLTMPMEEDLAEELEEEGSLILQIHREDTDDRDKFFDERQPYHDDLEETEEELKLQAGVEDVQDEGQEETTATPLQAQPETEPEAAAFQVTAKAAAEEAEEAEEPMARQGVMGAAPGIQPISDAVEELLEAEVYFDYTLLHSDVENRPYLLIGSLCVKNTGNQYLYNPIVCLRVNPVDGIKLGGQILPPNFVETMGVQTASGIKGWRYLTDDWFDQAQERGEYWIAPIQPMQIPPKASETFQNFQISFLKPEKRTAVTVEGMVLFNDQEKHFMSNNRISVSFG